MDVEVRTGELERRQRYDDARHSWMPSWWATGFYRDGSAPVRVGMLHAGRLDGVAGEVDVGMRALFDQEEWCGADGRSAIRRALGRAGEAMGLPPARSGALERAAAADVARLVLGGALPALEAAEAAAMRERDEQRASEGTTLTVRGGAAPRSGERHRR